MLAINFRKRSPAIRSADVTMSESDSDDFIRTLRVVKARDSKIQANREIWTELLDQTFDSLLVMCIGTVSNRNFEISVLRQLERDSRAWMEHQNHVLNLFLYVSHIGLKYRLFHTIDAQIDVTRRTPDDSTDYAYYFISHFKGEIIFRIAIIMETFCTRKRMIRVDKVIKYFKRTHIYENLYDAINLHVHRILDAIDEQIRITDPDGNSRPMHAPTEQIYAC